LAGFEVTTEELLAQQPPRKNFNVFGVDGEYSLRVAKVKDTLLGTTVRTQTKVGLFTKLQPEP
jgi:hypothetical protein